VPRLQPLALEGIGNCLLELIVAFQRKRPPPIGTKASYPGFIEPALASLIERVPSGDRWLHEIKFDGYRVQVHLANTVVRVFTRRGHDWTNRLIAADAWHINAGSAIIRRRSRGAVGGWHDRFRGIAERTERSLHQNR